MEWQHWQRPIIGLMVAAVVIVVKVAIIIGCYCCFTNKGCPAYKWKEERRIKLTKPIRTSHLSYPRQQRVMPTNE